MVFLGFPMVFLWFSYGFPMVFWSSHSYVAVITRGNIAMAPGGAEDQCQVARAASGSALSGGEQRGAMVEQSNKNNGCVKLLYSMLNIHIQLLET